MAGQSPLRRWKHFFGAFDSVDAAIEAAYPDPSRGEFRSIRGDIFELLCNAADEEHAERLCLILDDVMAESLETLNMIPAMPTVLATTDLGKSLVALRDHESKRVRVLASGIVSRWRASMLDNIAKLDNELEIVDQQPSTKGTTTIVGNDRVKTTKKATQPPLHKNTVGIAKKVSDPAVGIVHRAELCSEERMEAAKRKFQDAYREAEDAKRRRRVQKLVESPEMLKQRQKMNPIPRGRSRASCASSMVKKSFSVTRLAAESLGFY